MESKDCGCPVINEQAWHGKTFSWEGRCFFRKEVRFFFGVPMGIEDRTRIAAEEIERRGYVMEDPAVILVQPGLFKGYVLIAVAHPGDMARDVITFDARPMIAVVHRSEVPKNAPGMRMLKKNLSKMRAKADAFFVWYTTCPRCLQTEKKYTTVFLARLA